VESPLFLDDEPLVMALVEEDDRCGIGRLDRSPGEQGDGERSAELAENLLHECDLLGG